MAVLALSTKGLEFAVRFSPILSQAIFKCFLAIEIQSLKIQSGQTPKGTFSRFRKNLGSFYANGTSIAPLQ